jgi:PAS domain S-box-containing protein
MSQNLRQKPASSLLDLRAQWRRLSIQLKLLLPVVVALVVALVIIAVRIVPPIYALEQTNAQDTFGRQLDDLRDHLSSFLEGGRSDLLNLVGSSDITTFASARATGSDSEIRNARLAVSVRFLSRIGPIAEGAVPYSEIRYLGIDGQQLLRAVRNPDTGSGGMAPVEELSAEGNKDYFPAILKLPQGQTYLLPLVLQKLPSGKTELLLQIGSPVYFNGEPVGAIIVGLQTRELLAETFHVHEVGDYRAALVDADGTVLAATDTTFEPPVSVLGDPHTVQIAASIPRDLLLKGNQSLVDIGGRLYSTLALGDLAEFPKNSWSLVFSRPTAEVYANAQTLTVSIIATLVILFLIAVGGIGYGGRSLTRPILEVSQAASRIAAGDFQTKVQVRSEDEVGALGAALNTMSGRLAELVGRLESGVVERTRNIEIAAEIGREAAQLRNIDELLQRAVNAIRERFNFYHAQVFLVDDARQFAVLHTSTGEAGQQMLAMNHKLALGSDSVVGQTIERGRTLITLDTQKSEVPHRFNALLPMTRSEMALPLRAADTVIGALDIQSVEPDAFDQEDVQIFQLLADQIAIAIDNARLIDESEQRLQQVNDLNLKLTRAGWTEFLEEENPQDLAFGYDLSKVTAVSESSQDGMVSAEIKVRGMTVGSLSVEESADALLSEDDRIVLQTVADRVALAIENARLIEQSQQAASKIERLYDVSRSLGGAVDLDAVYRIVTEYLSAFEAVDWLYVLSARPNPTPRPAYYEYTYSWSRAAQPLTRFQVEGRLPGEMAPFDRLLPDPRAPRIADLETDLFGYDDLYNVFKEAGVLSVLLAPLSTPTHWFGMLVCQSERPHAFTQSFVQFVSAIADQVSIAVDNRRLFESVEAEARRNRALAEAAQLSSQVGVDFETGINNLFQAVAEPANFDRWWFGQLLLGEPGTTLHRVTSHFGEGSPLHYMARVDLLADQNAIAETTRIGQLVVVNDPTDHHVLVGLNRDKARAFGKHLAVPVRIGANVVGTMLIGRALTESDLDDRDVQLAITLASQIAVIMENQRLFTTAEAERQTLEAVLNSLPTGVIVIDAPDGEVALTNELARSLLGLDEAEPYKLIHTGSETPYADEEFPPQMVLSTMQPIFAEDMTVLKPSGERIDLIVNAAPIADADGKVISAVAVFQDVTELRELENVLQDSLRETTSLYEISRAIAAENELINILAVVVSQVVSILTPTHVFAIFPDDQGNPSQSYVSGLDSDWQVLPVEGPCPVPVSILQGDEGFAESDIATNPGLSGDPQLAELGVAGLGVFPLNARGRTVGWIVVGLGESRPFTPEERRFLSTLADQAAVAAENARLAQATVMALSETTLLYEASYNINRALSIESALLTVRDQLKAFAPTQIDIFLVITRQETSTTDWVVHWDVTDPETHGDITLDGATHVEDPDLIDAEPYFMDDVNSASEDIVAAFSRHPAWDGYTAQASVPLNVAGRSTGRLVVSFNRPYRFGRLERQFITTLADQAAIVINNRMLVQQTQDSLEETGTLYQSSRAITDAPDLQQVLGAIIDHAAPPLVNWAMLVRLLTPEWEGAGASVEVVANWSNPDTSFDLAGLHFTPGQFPAWPEVSTPELKWVEDVASADTVDEASRGFYQSLGLTTVVNVPLAVAGRPIGALMLGAKDPWPRSEREARIYAALADQVAISIENRNLLAQAERRARQLQTSAQVAQAATSILNLGELLDRTVNLIKESFDYDHVQIFLISPDKRDAQLVASTGEAGQKLLSIHHYLPVGSKSVIGQVTSTGKSQIAADTADARVVHRPNPYLPNTRSELALPLLAKNRILGALDVQSNRPGAFSIEDEAVLSNLADQVAVAIDNARLFELSMQRVEEMRFLFDVTRAATSTDELELAVEAITALIREHLDAAAVTLLLLDDTNTRLLRYSTIEPGVAMFAPDTVELDHPLFKPIIMSRRHEIIDDAQNIDAWRQMLPDVNSILLMPLVSRDEFVGILATSKKERHAFSDDMVQLVQTLSSSLSAIIQNARLLRQIQAANTRLREVDKLKSQFLANMSHELRTPLNSIIGFSRVILKGIDGPLTSMQEQDLSTIHESGKHLLNLVNDILDQAKIEAGKMELSYTYFSTADLIKSVMSTAVGLVKDKPVRLHQEVEADLPLAWGDEFRSRQVLLNLVSNASKFTMQGSVTVSAFHIDDNGTPMIQISVTDTGIGIAEDKLDSIFEAFQQVENTTARQYEGTGLGLPIAKSLIEMQGGRIWVASEPGVGSTFSFTLPMAPVVKADEEAAEAEVDNGIATQVDEAVQQAEAPNPGQRIVLVIEDEMSVVNLYRRYLAKSGYEVIGGTPEEAEDLAINYQPRVVVLDVNMPKRSGWDVLAKLKDRDETFEIPVIVCSVEADKERAFRLGAADYVPKADAERLLADTIKRVEFERECRKILIIDDQPESVRLIRDAIATDGRFVILEAIGGAQGVDMISSHLPDLVILDLRMPEMDGFAVLDQVRANPDTVSIPVLVITADDLTEDERQRLANAFVYQKQTINAEDLLSNVVSQISW